MRIKPTKQKILKEADADFLAALTSIETQQDEFDPASEKFKRIPSEKFGQFDVESHEYKTPNGSVGYIVLAKKTVGEDRYAMVVGYGVEGEDRATDWFKLETL